MNNPTPQQIIELRERLQVALSLSKAEAIRRCSRMVFSTPRAWEYWEKGERKMHPGLFELIRDYKIQKYIYRYAKLLDSMNNVR